MSRHWQIIECKNNTVLDILRVFNKVVDEFWNKSVSAELWPNFICFQGRYMLWLCAQMTDDHRERLARRATRIARRFPGHGLIRFREKFGNESRVTRAVDLQLYGNAEPFAEFARTQVASERAEKVASSDILRQSLVARAQATSRLARMSPRLRGTGSESGARRVSLD